MLYIRGMKELPTYEKDSDIYLLMYSEFLTDEMVLAFAIKKGKLNFNNFNYVINEHGTHRQNKNPAGNILSLIHKGLLRHDQKQAMLLRPTFKAKWQKMRDSNNTTFWLLILSIAISIAALCVSIIQLLVCLI